MNYQSTTDIRIWQCRSNPYSPIPVTIQPPPKYPYRGTHRSRMVEWSLLQGAGKALSADKFRARQIDQHHADYVAGHLNLEDYVYEICKYLGRCHDDTEVSNFVQEIAAQLETATLNKKGQQFSTCLNRAWTAYSENRGVQVPLAAQRERVPGTDDELQASDASERPVMRPTADRNGITQAFTDYSDGVEGAEESLLALVIEFAQRKSAMRMRNRHEAAANHDDVSQLVALTIWPRLSTFKGDSDKFFAWVDKITRNKGKDVIAQNSLEQATKAPLMVINPEGESDQNPEIFKDVKPARIRVLPSWIEGVDRYICGLIRESCDYAEIGRSVNLTEQAIRNRVYRMRRRITAEKLAATQK